MRKIGLFEAKQKLSELVERASSGEQIGITRRGRLAAVLVSPRPEKSLQEIFDEMDDIRRHSRKPKKVSTRVLIEEGRA